MAEKCQHCSAHNGETHHRECPLAVVAACENILNHYEEGAGLMSTEAKLGGALPISKADEAVVDDLMAKRAAGLESKRLGGPVEALRREIVEALRYESRNDHEPQGYANQLLDRVAGRLERGAQP